jgi:hypothetical protein
LLVALAVYRPRLTAPNGHAFIIFTELSRSTITVAPTTVEAFSLIGTELIGFAAISSIASVDTLIGFAEGSERTVVVLTTADLAVTGDADHALTANSVLGARHNALSLDAGHPRAALLTILTVTFLTRTAAGENKRRKEDDLRPITRRHRGSELRYVMLTTRSSVFHLKLSILTDLAGLNSP